MMINWTATGILLALSALLLVVFFAITFVKERGGKQAQLYKKYFGKRINKHRLNLFFQKTYVLLMRLPLLSGYVTRIRKRLEALHSYDEYKIRYETMRISLITLSAMGCTVLVLVMVSQDMLTLLWVMLGAVVVNGIIIDTFVNKAEDRILKKSVGLLEDNRHHFQRLKNVEEALYDAIQTAPHEASVHGQRIYEILTADNQKFRLDSYYDVAPNRYYKMFAGIAFLVAEFGDRVVKTGSMYSQAISQLVKEINEDILRRDKLNYLLKGLTTIAIAPILFVQPLESWGRNYFPIMSDFYDAKMGFVIKVSFFVVVLLCYLILKKLIENDEMRYVAKARRWMWEQKLYRLAPVRWLTDRVAPKKHKNVYKALTQLLKDANSPLTLEWLYVQRMLIWTLCFVVSMCMFLYMHSMSVNNVLNNPMRGMGMYGKLSADEWFKAQQKTDFDREVIQSLLDKKDVTVEMIVKKVSDTTGTDGNDRGVIKTAQRIIDKYRIVKTEYFKWWELMLGILISMVAYHIPVWLLMFQKRIRQMEMKTEVDQFHTMISILANFERIDVETILEWLERFAILFKEPIKNCLNEFSSGQTAAVEKLKDEAPFDSFVRIVEKLMLALEKIPVKAAFDDLENAREYYAERRKEYFLRLINQKSAWGTTISFIPMSYIVIAYLVLPMFYLSVVQMGLQMKQISQMG